MGEILSQSEIDALIGALHAGQSIGQTPGAVTTNGPAIRTYDFRRPDRFSKDQLRTISMVHGVFARLVSMALSVNLRFAVTVSVRSVDQVSYEEFVRSVPQPTVLMLLDLAPLEGKAVIEVNNTLALLIVDRLLGGAGLSTGAARPLTDVERLLMGRVGEKIVPALREAWHSILEITPALAGIETNLQFVQIASPGDVVLLISLEVQTPQQAGTINLCLPYLLLQPVLGRLSATRLFRASVRVPNAEAVRAALDETRVPVRVELGRARVRLGDLAELVRHDVVRLDRRSGAPLEVLVGDQVTFLATPGQVHNHLAVEIATALAPAR